jgi:hypothetical protein
MLNSGSMMYGTKASFIPFGFAVVLHTLASDIVTSQSLANSLDGLSAAMGSAAAVMAWHEKARGFAFTYGALAVLRALLGPSTVVPHKPGLFVFDCVFLGLVSLTTAVAVVKVLQAHRTHPAEPSAVA